MSTKQINYGNRIPVGPVSVTGLALSIGFVLVTLVADLGTNDEHSVTITQAHLYRKAFKPHLIMRLIELTLLLGGVLNYSAIVFNSFTSRASFTRKAADLTAAALFVVNITMAIFFTGPFEKKIGATFGKSVPEASDLTTLTYLHTAGLVLAIVLGVCNVIAYNAYLADAAAANKPAIDKKSQ